MVTIDRQRLAALTKRERATYEAEHRTSGRLFAEAEHLFGRVPMTWMAMWSGGFPLYLDRAIGNHVTDVDGHEYVDFALGDTGAMAGHSPRPTVEAVRERMETLGGVTTMLPTADAEWVGAELSRLPARRVAGRDEALADLHPQQTAVGTAQLSLAEAMRVVGDANRYLSDQAPWKLAKTGQPRDKERMDTILHVALQVVGAHQVANAGLALAMLRAQGTLHVPEAALARAMTATGLPVMMGALTPSEVTSAPPCICLMMALASLGMMAKYWLVLLLPA